MGSSELRAALERGRRAVLVCPPAVEHAADLWELLPPRVLIVCPDRATAVQFADAAPADRRVHPITSLGRATRLLKAPGAGPIAPARSPIVSPERRAAALREVTDALDPTPCAPWRRGTDAPPAGTVAVCLDLPDRAEFSQLARDAAPVLVLTAAQLPYARTLALPLDPLPLPWALERGRAAAAELRTRLAERIAAGGLGAELAVLEPLFDRFDPAEVAAAALALRRGPGPGPPVEPAKPRGKGWGGVRKRHRAGPQDFGCALVKG